MKIEILYFDGCPHAEDTANMLKQTAGELGIKDDIQLVRVLDNQDAIAKRFLGSPSVRINGKDLEISEDERTEYSMRCRVYRDGNRMTGVPPRSLIMNALKKQL